MLCECMHLYVCIGERIQELGELWGCKEDIKPQ